MTATLLSRSDMELNDPNALHWAETIPEQALEIQASRDFAISAGVAGVFFMPETVQDRVDEIAEDQLALEDEINPIESSMVTILDGGNPFSSKLRASMTRLRPQRQTGPEISIKISRYGEDNQTALEVPRLKLDVIEGLLRGQHAVAIDDLGDEWGTMEFTAHHLTDQIDKLGLSEEEIAKRVAVGATSVSALVLCSKGHKAPSESLDRVDVGLYIPRPWASGMGMDALHGRHRYSEAIMLSESQELKYFFEMQQVLEALGDVAVLEHKEITWIEKYINEAGISDKRIITDYAEAEQKAYKLAA